MRFLERRPCLLYEYGLLGDFTLGLRLLGEGRRARAFDIIRAIWETSWFLGDRSLFLVPLDLALQVPLEFLYPFLYLIDTAFA